MTIVDKASESSGPSAYQNPPGSSEAVSPGDMDAGSASWGAVSSLNDVSNHTLSLGPVPGAVVYSSSSVSDKSKPSPQKDQGTVWVQHPCLKLGWECCWWPRPWAAAPGRQSCSVVMAVSCRGHSRWSGSGWMLTGSLVSEVLRDRLTLARLEMGMSCYMDLSANQ